MTKWQLDPNTRGSHLAIIKGSTPEDLKPFFRPINNKIWWAGEHAIKEIFRTTQGAYDSGEDAAKGIIESIANERGRKVVIKSQTTVEETILEKVKQ